MIKRAQKHLDNLRRKPETVRSQIALWSSGALTLVIGLIWLTTLPGLFESERASSSYEAGSNQASVVRALLGDAAGIVNFDDIDKFRIEGGEFANILKPADFIDQTEDSEELGAKDEQ